VEIVRVLDAAPTAPAEARLSLGALRRAIPSRQLEDLRLVVSELVTNAVLHAGLRVGDPITMTVRVTEGRIRVEVVDGGCGFPQAPAAPAAGLGLPIVDRLSDRWGTERTSETKVWAEFAR